MATLEQAQARLRELGVPEEDWTPEVLKRFQWAPSDPLKDVVVENAKTAQELKDDLALLKEEAEAANVPAKIISKIIQFGAHAIGV